MDDVLVTATGSASHVGLVRRHNEDSRFVGTRVFLVADGMGGHAAGDVASRLTTDTVAALDAGRLAVTAIRAAVREANERVIEHAATHPESAGLGSTLAGLALLEGDVSHWCVFHVGDSRVYSFRDGVLRQLTVDHSEVQELVAQGRLTAAEAAVHPSRNVITRAIGEHTAPDVDVVLLPATTGGRFLVCSDGLTSEVDDEELAAILAAFHPPQATADHLVRRALENGGRDNVTVVVVDEPAAGTPTPVVAATNPRGAP